MSVDGVESQPWSRRKWWGVVLGLFALQIVFLVWLGAHGPAKPRAASPVAQFKLAGTNAAAWLALTDPTLFAQGHPQGFSGAGWMTITNPEYQPPEWSEPPRWLALDAQQFGSDFRRFVQTNQPFAFASVGKPEPELTLPEIGEVTPVTAPPSALRVEGPLTSRRLLSQPVLKGQPFSDLLTNTVVQVLVNADGNVLSPVLLGPSGKKEADDDALAVAQAAQFEPLPRNASGSSSATALVLGTLVFEWQTLPMPSTNTPPANP